MSDQIKRDLVSPWWEAKTQKDALDPAMRVFQYFADQDRSRVEAYSVYTRLYANRRIHGESFLSNYTAAFAVQNNKYSRVPLNVAKIHVDALTARIGTSVPRPTFLTDAGNYSLQRKARLTERWVDNQFYVDNVDQLATDIFRDACIMGTGCIKTFPHPRSKQICNERVHPGDIFVDPAEAMANGKPTHLYQRAFVSRHQLSKLFPSRAGRIKKAGMLTKQLTERGFSTQDNLVEVVEAWKLPSWKGAGDGKRIIFIDGAVLAFDDYEVDDFPISFFRWKKDPSVGFWGAGLVEELIGIHFDVNASIKHVEKCIELMPKPYILSPQGGGVSEGEIANVPGIIIEYAGSTPPQIVMPPSVPNDVVAYIQDQLHRAALISGLASMNMQGRIPSGLETGQAVRDYHDIESKDFATVMKAFEDYILVLSRKNLIAGKTLAERCKADGEKYTVVLPKDRYSIEELDWNQVSLDPTDDSYVIKVWPKNKLSQTPAGRKADVSDLRMMFPNTITEEIGLRLLDFPDLKQELDLIESGRREIGRLIELAVDQGKYEAPEPTLPLDVGFDEVQKALNEAKSNKVPRKHIAVLRQLLRQFEAYIQKREAATIERQLGMAQALGGPPALDSQGGDVASVGGEQGV